MLLSDEKLARRLEAVSDRFMFEWLEGLPVRIERFGAAAAAASPERPEVDFMNRVCGLWPEDEEQVDRIVAWYRALGIRAWFELAPSECFARLAARLTSAGAAQVGFHSRLWGPVDARTRPKGGIRVEEARDPVAFADVLLAGHEVPENARVRDRPSVERWKTIDRWRLYLAHVGETPAGAGMLALDDGVGYLANASTLPEYRRQGVQTALIARRIADAAAADCELVCSGADFGSTSQRNLERAGLRIAYTKAVWRLGEAG